MNFGMLWFDNDPKTGLSEKIEKASAYYRKKYGQIPNQCVVNPSMLSDGEVNSPDLKVSASPTILPNHLWIGFNTAIKQAGKSN
ncbi:MAG: hypothetical protein IIC79_03600 [Chloroflexi bacterium]|nr:hypothetical protein [Chloroflexota bacterium]